MPQKGHKARAIWPPACEAGRPGSGRCPAGPVTLPSEIFVIRLLVALLLCLPALGTAFAQAPDPNNTLVIELKTGKVLIKLRPDLAPKHVERVKRLAKEGFYNGLTFHRVIANFMAQTGDPTGTGSGGSKYPDLPAEFSNVQYGKGSVGAARTSDPNSANSQFFICFGLGCKPLTGQYTLWGEVIEGMEHVGAIARGEPPPQPDKMLKVYLLADKK
jgi:peptidylprolyl isomerase